MHWLGYRNMFSYGSLRMDLDVTMPADLVEALVSHSGISREEIEAHGLSGKSVLPLASRRAFCPKCWVEEGPYRRREWASGWSLICARHQSLLCERPRLTLPLAPHAEDSWTEFYETPTLWRNSESCWENERWLDICRVLGVNPRTEATRANLGLRRLQQLAHQQFDRRAPEPGGAPIEPYHTPEEWVVKRDLTIYGTLKFFGNEPSLLQTLDSRIEDMQLCSASHGEFCGMGTPETNYDIRVLSALVAGHVWERLARGRWRCQQGAFIEQMLPRVRWNDEDWWLERRLFSWPPMFQKAGRELFHKQDAWSQLPPWSPCRENCTRLLSRDYRGTTVIRLADSWECRWNGPHDTRDWVAGRRWGAPCTNPRAGIDIITRLAYMPGVHAFMAGEEARFPSESGLDSATIQRAPPA
jgi:hypothetical protein